MKSGIYKIDPKNSEIDWWMRAPLFDCIGILIILAGLLYLGWWR